MGDLRTPEGVYFFVRIKEEDEMLEEYGNGAREYGKRVYELNYPNKFDLMNGKGGNGIWLHSTNEPERLKDPYNTKGCVVVNNYDILDISKYITIKKTPIIIVNNILAYF